MYTESNKNDWRAMADPAIVKEIGANLKQMRLNRNLSQEQLARISGLNRVTISRLEGGRAATLLTIVGVLRAMDKLDILNGFREDVKISPLERLRMSKNKRQRASHPRKNT